MRGPSLQHVSGLAKSIESRIEELTKRRVAGHQDCSALKESGSLDTIAIGGFRGIRESLGQWIVNLSEVDLFTRANSGLVSPPNNQDLPILQKGRGMPVAGTAQTFGESREGVGDGIKQLGEKHGVPMWCTGLAPMSLPNFHYDSAQVNADVWSLFLQETARRGVLIRRGGLLFNTYMHKAGDIDETLSAIDETLAVIATAVESGSVEDSLQVGRVQESFRRL